MTKDELERLRARLKSPATTTVLTAGTLRFEHVGSGFWNGDMEGLYEPLTATLAEWERLAELILGVDREEVTALLEHAEVQHRRICDLSADLQTCRAQRDEDWDR